MDLYNLIKNNKKNNDIEKDLKRKKNNFFVFSFQANKIRGIQ